MHQPRNEPVPEKGANVLRVRPQGALCIACEDITERKRTEAELAKTEQRLRAVIANAPIILFALDRLGVFMLSEGRGLADLGLQPGQVVGQSVFELYRDAPQVLSAVRRALAGESFTAVVEANDLVFETHYLLVLDEGGHVAGVNGVAINITERKRAEEALQKAQTELAHVTRVTTLGELAASIAHEINQPLAAIVTNGNACRRWLAREPPHLDEAREALQCIIDDGQRAGAIITRLRALLRKTAAEPTRLALAPLVHEVVRLTQPECVRQGVALHVEVAADLPPVVGDRVQIQQVLLNLVLNSLEALAPVTERPREVWIRVHHEAADMVRVAVEDTGVGIAPEQLDAIFTAFYTTKAQGLGMGLAISRTIIEAHGGRLWAAANSGNGATFQFTLPSERKVGERPAASPGKAAGDLR